MLGCKKESSYRMLLYMFQTMVYKRVERSMLHVRWCSALNCRHKGDVACTAPSLVLHKRWYNNTTTLMIHDNLDKLLDIRDIVWNLCFRPYSYLKNYMKSRVINTNFGFTEISNTEQQLFNHGNKQHPFMSCKWYHNVYSSQLVYMQCL